MKFILGIIISACLLFTSCEEAFKTDYKIKNESSYDCEILANNRSYKINSKSEISITSYTDIDIQLISDYPVTLKKRYLECYIEDVIYYDYTVYNLSNFTIKLVYNNLGDFYLIPKSNVDSPAPFNFQSSLLENEFEISFLDSDLDAFEYVKIINNSLSSNS